MCLGNFGCVWQEWRLIMDYKKQIIEIVDKIEDVNILKYFYLFIKGKLEAED